MGMSLVLKSNWNTFQTLRFVFCIVGLSHYTYTVAHHNIIQIWHETYFGRFFLSYKYLPMWANTVFLIYFILRLVVFALQKTLYKKQEEIQPERLKSVVVVPSEKEGKAINEENQEQEYIEEEQSIIVEEEEIYEEEQKDQQASFSIEEDQQEKKEQQASFSIEDQPKLNEEKDQQASLKVEDPQANQETKKEPKNVAFYTSKLADYVEVSLVYPIGLLVCTLFTVHMITDSDLVVPELFGENTPIHLGLMIHVSFVIFVFVDLFLFNTKYPNNYISLGLLFSFGILYIGWVHIVFFVTSEWTYPVVKFDTIQLRLFFLFGIFAMASLYFFLCFLLNYFIWHFSKNE